MCGIVGFTTPGQDPAAAKQIVQGMADLIRHRGPDGEGCLRGVEDAAPTACGNNLIAEP